VEDRNFVEFGGSSYTILRDNDYAVPSGSKCTTLDDSDNKNLGGGD